jgi:hypothetical protein
MGWLFKLTDESNGISELVWLERNTKNLSEIQLSVAEFSVILFTDI